VALKV